MVTQTEDPRAELERLRKLKRLRDLEAKAGVTPSAPAAPAGMAAPAPINVTNPFGRAAIKAGDAAVGGMRFVGTPGRAADNWLADQLDKVNLPYPAIEFDRKGIRLIDVNKDVPEDKPKFTYNATPISAPTDAVQTGADVVGTIAGYLAPGTGVSKGMNFAQNTVKAAAPKVTQALSNLVTRFTPTGASFGARAGRYGGRLAATVPEAAAHSYVLGASTAGEGEDKGARGLEFATDPLSYLAIPALSAIYRGGVGVRTGGARFTPKAIDARVSANLGPQAAAGARQVSPIDVPLEAMPVLQGANAKDSEAVARMIYRNLSDGGVPDDLINSTLSDFGNLAAGGQGAAPRLESFIRQRLEAFPKAVENVENSLYEIGQRAPEVTDALKRMRGSQAQRLTSTLEQQLGKQDSYTRDKKLQKKKATIGEEAYEPILARGSVDEAASSDLRQLLNDPEIQRYIPLSYRTKLSMGSVNTAEPDYLPTSGGRGRKAPPRKAVTLNQRIDENPLEVAHRLYSELGKRMRASTDGDTRYALGQIQDVLRGPLFRAGGREYVKANSEYRNVAVAQGDLSFADKFFTESLRRRQVLDLRDEYKTASAASKESMRTSLGETIQDEMRRAVATQDFAHLGRLKNEGRLDAIEEILNISGSKRGTEVANQIRALVDEQAAIKRIDPTVRTDQASRLEQGRRAYAGRTGALEYSGRLKMEDLAQDAILSVVGSAVMGGPVGVPFRLGLRGIQKGLAAQATPSRSARGLYARTMLEGDGAVAVQPRVRRGNDSYKEQFRVNGKFGGKPIIEDPVAPVDDFVEPRMRRIDEREGPQQVSGPGPRQIESPEAISARTRGRERRALPAPAAVAQTADDTAESARPLTPAEQYAQQVREANRAAMEALDQKAFEKEAARGDARQAQRAADDAERAAAEQKRIQNRTRSEELEIERQRQRKIQAEERARRAANPEPGVMEKMEGYRGPQVFSQAGRAVDRTFAEAGDPRALKDAMEYIVGAEEPAALQANLRRFTRDGYIDWYLQDPVNRINDVWRAIQGEKDVPADVARIVGRMNKANRDYLAQKLENPAEFDLLQEVENIRTMPEKGVIERDFETWGPPATMAAGGGALAMLAKSVWDNWDRRSPEQKRADFERNMYNIDPRMDGEAFVPPSEDTVRKMQRALNNLGYTDDEGRPLTVDGGIGPRFKQAVRKFQRANGLKYGDHESGLTPATQDAFIQYYE